VQGVNRPSHHHQPCPRGTSSMMASLLTGGSTAKFMQQAADTTPSPLAEIIHEAGCGRGATFNSLVLLPACACCGRAPSMVRFNPPSSTSAPTEPAVDAAIDPCQTPRLIRRRAGDATADHIYTIPISSDSWRREKALVASSGAHHRHGVEDRDAEAAFRGSSLGYAMLLVQKNTPPSLLPLFVRLRPRKQRWQRRLKAGIFFLYFLRISSGTFDLAGRRDILVLT